MHSTSKYVKHWRYRPLALACLSRGAMCHSLTSGTAFAYLGVLARVLPWIEGSGAPRVVVDPRSCLSATSRLWISWVWLAALQLARSIRAMG